MRISLARPNRRWTAPVAAAALVAGAATLPPLVAGADPGLPALTAAEILATVHQARPVPLSGTVRERLDLGLPELSASMTKGAGGAELASVLTGAHEWRVWYGGPGRSRVALLGQAAETDVVVNGRDVWVWSSAERTATHVTVEGDTRAATPGGHPRSTASPRPGLPDPSNPQAVAEWALAQLDPTTRVTTTTNETVAGRATYGLSLTPTTPGTRVRSVTLALDAQTWTPLAVRVASTQQVNPAIEVAFTQVDFAVPADSVFAFTPPPGTTVTTRRLDATNAGAGPKTTKPVNPSRPAVATPTGRPVVSGTGWAAVVAGRLPAAAMGADPAPGRSTDPAAGRGGDPGTAQLLALLPRASGTWGSGRVLDGPLFSLVVTDDGRYAVGAVAPSALYAALPAR